MKNRRLAKSELPEDERADPRAERPAGGATSTETQRGSRWLVALRTVGGFVLVASVSLAVAWGARRYLMTSPRFALEQVVVDGQKSRTKDGLLARGSVKMGQNLFSIDMNSVENKMLGDPYVKNVTVARQLPDTLVVHIEERVPAAIVIIGVDAFLVTRDGETFKRLEVGDPSDLPVITGLRPALAETDHEGFAECVRRALDVVVDYQQSTLASKMSLQEIHIDPGMAMSLVVGSPNRAGTVSLVLGGPPFRRKLEQAARVSSELERRGQSPDAILLDGTSRPERVVARVR
jgi:cell division protein FtsQ